MGVKTKNFKYQENITLINVYAELKTLTLKEDNKVEASFRLYESRGNLQYPLYPVAIQFIWDRKSDLAEMAYNESKKRVEHKRINPITKEEETYYETGPFYGWEDDIVTGEETDGNQAESNI